MMSLANDILNGAIDSQVDIGTVLRKCKVLAARLKSNEFAEWVNHELNGYPAEVELPEYRCLNISAKAHLVDKWGRTQMPNAPIMATQIPERFRHRAEKADLRGPITAFVSLVDGAAGEIVEEWPQELAIKFGAVGYSQDFQCIGARTVITHGAIVALIDTVRNRIVDFILKLQELAPEAGESSQAPVPAQEKIAQVFNQCVFRGNVAVASSQITQSIKVTQDDWKGLVESLQRLGVNDNEIEELKNDLATKGDSKETVSGWLGKLALAGGTTLATDGIQHAAKAVAAYFGWTT